MISNPASNAMLLRCLQLVARTAPDLSIDQLMSLLVIGCDPGIRMTALALACRKHESTVSRGVKAMMDPCEPGAPVDGAGLVEVMSGADDRRARHIVLTDKGQRLLAELNTLMAAGVAETSGQDETDFQDISLA